MTIITSPSSTLLYTGIDIVSNDVKEEGIYTFTVTATLTDYAPYASQPTYQSIVTYTITLYNPCPDATYTVPSISVVSYMYYLRYAPLIITFNDFTST